METILVYVALGIGAGLLAGMLGMGGGQVVVPGSLNIFPLKGFHDGYLVHMAPGTSLSTSVVTSLPSAHSHYRLGSIGLHLVKRMTPGIVVGAALTHWLPVTSSKKFGTSIHRWRANSDPMASQLALVKQRFVPSSADA